MIPSFKIKDRPPTDMGYTQVTHVDAHGRTILEFKPGDAMKSIVQPVDRFVGIDRAEATVSTPQGEGVATIQLRFSIKATNATQAFEMYDEAAEQALEARLQEAWKQELAAAGRMQLPPAQQGQLPFPPGGAFNPLG